MRKAMSILCSIAFAISGIAMAITASDPSPGTGYKSIAAATLPQIYTSAIPNSVNLLELSNIPEDLLKDLAAKKGVLDTVYVTKTDTVIEQVTKVKRLKAAAPKPIVVRDTIHEAHYYIATQTGVGGTPAGQCKTYEIREVDNICSDMIPPIDVDVGE